MGPLALERELGLALAELGGALRGALGGDVALVDAVDVAVVQEEDGVEGRVPHRRHRKPHRHVHAATAGQTRVRKARVGCRALGFEVVGLSVQG